MLGGEVSTYTQLERGHNKHYSCTTVSDVATTDLQEVALEVQLKAHPPKLHCKKMTIVVDFYTMYVYICVNL